MIAGLGEFQLIMGKQRQKEGKITDIFICLDPPFTSKKISLSVPQVLKTGCKVCFVYLAIFYVFTFFFSLFGPK